MIGTLVKITSAKKLMVKINKTAFITINDRLKAEYKKKDFPQDRLATFMLDNEDSETPAWCYFVMISLDKYDRQNMRKFEQLLKKDIAFQFRMKPYDFIPEGQDEQVCGINLELISIRQVKAKPSPFVQLMDEIVAARKTVQIKELMDDLLVESEDEIDEIADKAAAAACSQSSELNQEERAIDEDVEKKVLKVLELERQTGGYVRRRRTPVTLSEVEKDDLIGAEE